MKRPLPVDNRTRTNLGLCKCSGRRALTLAALVAGAFPLPARSAQLYDDGQTKIRWDNTVRYSTMFRVEGLDARLIADPNSDDGNRSFRTGMVSNRFDLLSELGVSTGGFGAEVSGAAWYDTIYNARNDHGSPGTFNPNSASANAFTRAVRNLHGRDVELVNGFVHGELDVASTPLRFRIGRHSLVWGESIFFADNAIAAGQAPVDAIKALTLPYARASDVVMPVAQASVSWQPRPNLTVELYYQFEWRKSRLPGVGSFFSAADIADVGGERIVLGPGQYLSRGNDQTAPASGQFGVALRINTAAIDYGFYALRFNAKYPQLYLRPTTTVLPAASPVERSLAYGLPSGGGADGPFKIDLPPGLYQGVGVFGTYNLVYPKGIEIYGMSLSGYLGDSNIAGEISGRRHMPLVSRPRLVRTSVLADGGKNALYAVGETLHAQVSSISVLAPNRFWDGASFSLEVAANHRLRVAKNAAALEAGRDRTAVAFRANFEPQYFRVLPNLDVTLPLGFGHGLSGNSSIDGSQNARSGDIQFGIRAVYRAVWEGSLTMTHFLGGPAPQPFADRDFVSLSIRRAF